MTRIADLLARDLAKPIEEIVRIGNGDPEAVFTELIEYVATPGIEAAYESLFSALAAAVKSPDERVGVWISGFLGSGKTSFAKNLGYVLANREVRGAAASSLFLKQVESKAVGESVQFLNRAAPYEVFMFDLANEWSAQTGAEGVAEVMYRILRRDLDDAEDAAAGAQPSPSLSLDAIVEKSFWLCEARRPGKSFAFIIDNAGEYASGAGRLEGLGAVVERFGRESLRRMKAGAIPGPVWIVVTAEESLQQISRRFSAGPAGLSAIEGRFPHRIDLSAADIGEVAVRRVLGKRAIHEPILREIFEESGASLIRNLRLERSSLCTDFDERRFVRCYPYLPHLIELSIAIMAGIRLQPNTLGGANRTIVKQAFEMLASEPAQLGERPLGALVSLDKIYDLVEANIPAPKRKDLLDLRERFDCDEDYPRMAARVAKTICLLDYAALDYAAIVLPPTTANIAALLIQRVTEAPPRHAVAAILHRLQEAGFVRETEDGWKLGDSHELRRTTASLARLEKAVGAVNPRPPGWRNGLIQLAKQTVVRSLAWYTRPVQAFHAAAARSLEEVVSALDRLSANIASQFSWNTSALDELSTNMAALEAHVARLKKTNLELRREIDSMRGQLNALTGVAASGPGELAAGLDTNGRLGPRFSIGAEAEGDRTAYIVGLFGTGRRYINELMLHNVGDRARFFRDGIRLHPGPTPMIYSGHATIRYASRAQRMPAVMKGVLEAVESGFADLIFIYRHPLDSLLTNWIWWRTFLHDNQAISGISQIYKNTDDLCADLERNFSEFKSFADGDPGFFAGSPGPRFLSFAEFVEETELHLQSAPLALRLEDFTADPLKEFSKIAAAMSLDLDLSSLCVHYPASKPYGYLAVQGNAPRFRSFIDELDAETKMRIEKIGYRLKP